ncbi:MAG: HD-GYP domain-containing protein [Leptospirales bacterium]
MKKNLPVDKLAIGMKVVGVDKSWLETNLISHTFTIHSQEDIDRLKSGGIKQVMIEESRADHTIESSPDPVEEDSPKELPELPSGKVQEIMSLQQETVLLLQKAFKQTRIKSALPTLEIRKHVRETVRMLLENPLAISLLADIHDNDDETYVHSANTMLLATGFAIRHQMPEVDCVLWGMAALLHDIGKTQIPQEVLKKPGPLSFSEWEIMHHHPQLGFKILRKSDDPDVNGLSAQVAVEHHERQNGSGYPHHLSLDQVHPVSRSLMVLDIYEALTAHRVYRKGISPQKVIRYLLDGHKDKVSATIILELAAMVGIYPVGTFIATDKGEIGMVLNYSDPENHQGDANILFLFDQNKTILSKPQARLVPGLNPEKIIRTYDYRELGFSPEQVEMLLSMGLNSPLEKEQ